MLIAKTGANAPRKKKAWLAMTLVMCVGTLLTHTNAKVKLPGISDGVAPSLDVSEKLEIIDGRRKLTECTDTDNGLTDMFGQPCAAYSNSPVMCGTMDFGDFVTGTLCCACGGGYTATEAVTEEETTTDDSSTTADSCVNLDNSFLLNSYGYGCEWYETTGYEAECPYMNTDLFDASVLCCACGGGSTAAEEYVEDVIAGECVNLDNTALLNYYGQGCSYYETSGYEAECPYMNTDYFDASVLCCACGGGSVPGSNTSDDSTSTDDTSTSDNYDSTSTDGTTIETG
jgi:hypothetical protein